MAARKIKTIIFVLFLPVYVCFWLQGFFEVANPESISGEQLEQIKNHLNLVFKHEIDPSMGPKEHQQKL